MKTARFSVMFLVGSIILSACSEYKPAQQSKCTSMADCNLGKTCGEMVPCEDGECITGKSTTVPCKQSCEKDEDCPSDMHCSFLPTDEGVCKLNGLCDSSGDCRGLKGKDCLGSFECVEGKCNYYCLSDDSCDHDSECILMDKGCCCASEAGDFVAVNEDRKSDWSNRPECVNVSCPLTPCYEPRGIEAVCMDGYCQVETKQQDVCSSDAQCTKVPGDCCGCDHGGLENAVLLSNKDEYLSDLEQTCSMIDPECWEFSACTSRPAVCHDGQCMVLGQWCDCPDRMVDWDPVCVNQDNGQMTLPSECVAQCLDQDVVYHGNCDCQLDCFVGDPFCASNSQTYNCGQMEVECNGQQVKYRGECSERCDQCLELDRMPIPVCGADFRDWSDVCFADCHEESWWHEGACMQGEGASCSDTGTECPGDGLSCLINSIEGFGFCVKTASCIEANHCAGQNLPHDECEGSWECSDEHECNWNCN